MTDPRLDRAQAQVMARHKAQLEEARKRLLSTPYARGLRILLRSEAGQALMAELEGRYVFGELLGESADETYFRLGQRDVVMTLRALRDAADHIERTGE